MSDNIKETQEEQQIQESAPAEKKRLGKKEILIIVCAAVALVATVAGIIIGIALGKKDDTPEPSATFDLLADDLSEYIEIDSKYYKGYTAEINNKHIDFLVENEIIKTLCTNKDKENPVEDGDGIISVGDVVFIFYNGYYLKGEEKVYFTGGSNVGKSSYELEIGSGGFIPGFEYNMIGKNPADYDTDNPMIIETYFPEQYHTAELAGKTAWFEVTVEKNTDGTYKMTEYNAPKLTDEFITETLLVTSDMLAGYEGETIVDKYRARERESYVKENGYDDDTLKEEAFWRSVMAGAVVKKYPESLLNSAYTSLIAQIEETYEGSIYALYYTLDEFGKLYLGMTSGDWRAEAENVAKEQVKQQLIFFHIMNVEGLKPSEEEYNAIFDEYLIEALEAEHIIPERYDDNAAYEAAKEKYKADIIAKNGEDYFKSMLYLQIGMNAILSYGSVVEITE